MATHISLAIANSLQDSKNIIHKNYGNRITLSINGKKYTITKDVPPDTTLNKFIRSYAHLTGTKHMCNEGGCGACVVSVKYCHPVTKQDVVMSVNSCLVLVYACHGWSVRTVEGIGNKKDGYHKVQTTLAYFNGTQCGYCSPGFVMNMYSLLEGNDNLTMEEVEKSFSGHICRCTGYRPILDAFKSLAVDASDDLKAKCADIEDLLQICPKSGSQCNGKCQLNGGEMALYDCIKNEKDSIDEDKTIKELSSTLQSLKIQSTVFCDTVWYKVLSVKEIFEVLNTIPDSEAYMLVAGNTAQGAYRNKRDIKHYIDVKDVPDLRTHSVTYDGLHLGANITLTETIQVLKATHAKSPDLFPHLCMLAGHIELVANVSVRNVGTLAGNLTLKHEHQDFPSDIFLILETAGANLQIEDGNGMSDIVPVQAFLNVVMHKKIISKIIIPALESRATCKTYKIMPRAQNAPGILNAGFLFHVDETNTYRIVSKPSVVFGGISPDFIHAINLEKFLIGKNVLNDSVLRQALNILDGEIMIYKDSQNESFEYKKKLAVSLFYRFVLSLDPAKVEPKYRSGAYALERELSKGYQEYSTDKTLWPISKPMPKIEALSQTAGEAEYVNDIPHHPFELQGALVVTKLSKAKIVSIDPAPALKMPGVVAFFSAKDIPGDNTFVPVCPLYPEKEELFCSGQVLYTGQPVGIILAETREIALKAADCVKIMYADVVSPKLHVKDIAIAKDEAQVWLSCSFNPKLSPPKDDIKHYLKGTIESPSQYHFTMETQSCLCVPKEGELTIYSATQWIAFIQEAVSLALDIPESRINISTKRIGGGYGCKITRASMVATACSVASYITQRPVRLVLDIETNMAAIGKRNNCYAEYEVGVDESGKILLLNVTVFEDNGLYFNEPSSMIIAESLSNIYDSKFWSFKGFDVRTDKASNTWTRAPGTVEAILIVETIMEHIASILKKDPLEVRLANANESDQVILDMIASMVNYSDFKKRKEEIDVFNKENRWKKKGISLIPMRYKNVRFGPLHALISVYAGDGSVTICHGGIEMGQGINTKVSQVVAAKLGVELDKVSVKATNSLTSPNNVYSGASATSENVCKAALMACDELLEKLEPIKVELGENSTWLEIVKKAFLNGIDLMTVGHFQREVNDYGFAYTYDTHGVAVSEVEVDLLTGNHLVHRTDILEDAGQSISPEVDIGQVEGAFMMGLGLFTSEELKYDEKTGALKTNRTWNYHPPGARDIPSDLRVKFLKNSSNPEGVLGSKATGEPPLLLSTSVLFAIRHAVKSAREDAGNIEDWFELHPPLTPEKIFLTSLTSKKDFTVNCKEKE